MPTSLDGLRFPLQRVLLPRTRLAYIHLKNLLSDAKRERASRVFGYVAIWLPEELVVLYLQEGEIVTATRTTDGRTFEALPIADAMERVPVAPEFGAICFHEAEDEQLACMFAAQTIPDVGWPSELAVDHPTKLFPYLMATTFDGTVEVISDDLVNYLIFRDGAVRRAFLAGDQGGSIVEQVARLFASAGRRSPLRVRRWPVAPPLQVQAAPALIAAYRELARGLVAKLTDAGNDSAAAIAEHARKSLAETHPVLEYFAVSGRAMKDPATDQETLTASVAAWIAEFLWTAAASNDVAPEKLLRDLMYERRHLFQNSGLCDALPWRVTW